MSKLDLDTLTYADLEAKEKRLFDELETVQDMKRAWCKLFGKEDKSLAEKDNKPPLGGKSTHDAAVLLTTERGKPLKTKEILTGFQSRGKASDSKDPMVNLYNGLDGATKRKDSQLIKIPGGYWGLKGRDEDWIKAAHLIT